MLPIEHAQYFKNIELSKLKPTAPLDKLDKEIKDTKIIAYGPPTIALCQFIDLLLVDATKESKPLPSFYDLVEVYGLVVYDKVIDGQIVCTSELLGTLRQREQQADKSFDDYSFQFWETLVKESKYSVFRDDVAMAYGNAGKLLFPWFNMDGGLVWLNTGEPTIGSVTQEAPGIEDIIEKPVVELLALLRCKPERKRTLVAVADNEDDAMQLLYELEGLNDFKKILETELCRVKTASYQFEESRKADISKISSKITEFDQWLDNYRATGKLEDITPQHGELETPSSKVEYIPVVADNVPYKNISKCLNGYWERLWGELPDEQRQAWRKAIDPVYSDDKLDGRVWESREWQERKTVVENYDAQYDPSLEDERFVAWHDCSMNARTWLDEKSVTPKEAAMLLCRLNPLKDQDPEHTFVDGDKTSPDRYRLLLRVFEGKASLSPESRTLMQWRSIAQERGLRYHPWIEEYVQATGLDDATPLNTTAVIVGAVTNIPTPWLIADPNDPSPKYPWYIPARYFARQLVIKDSTLLTKRDLLANKVVQSLTKAGIYKRGGEKSFDPGTVLKAFVNVTLG